MTQADVNRDNEEAAAPGQILPIVEERARVEKRSVTTGKVRIRRTVEASEEKARANLEAEQVEVTRVPIDRVATEAPVVRTEGDLTIVPVLEEVLFVEKQLVLKEELHIRRHVTTETVEVPVTLRRERARIQRVAEDESNNNRGEDDDV